MPFEKLTLRYIYLRHILASVALSISLLLCGLDVMGISCTSLFGHLNKLAAVENMVFKGLRSKQAIKNNFT